MGQSACFVKGDRVYLAHVFKRRTRFNEHAVLCRLPDGGDHRGRRCKHECARAEDDQHGNRTDKGLLMSETAGGEEVCADRHKQCHGHQPSRPDVCKLFGRGFVFLCLVYKVYHLLKRRVGKCFSDPHIDRAETIYRSREDIVAHHLVNRKRLAGHDGLVNRGFAQHYLSVCRKALAGEDADNIADHQVFCRHLLLFCRSVGQGNYASAGGRYQI